MKKSLLASFTIIGTVIGSGFVSGKEIVVFFSRFGIMSIPCIFLASILFFLLFKFMLNYGQEALERIKTSKFAFILNFILCLIFSSAMFAGIINLLTFDKKWMNFLIFFIILMLCLLVYKFGMAGLNKINMIFVPIMVIVFLALLISKLSFIKIEDFSAKFICSPIIYSILYVFLNTANSGIIIASLSKDMTKRQKTQVALFSALALFAILFIANIVLNMNKDYFSYAMPLVSLFEDSRHIILTLLVLVGCLTTLITLVFTLSSSMRGKCKNEFIVFFTSIILPLLLSFCGFNIIVEYFYPFASILGIYLLADLFFIPFFKRAYNKVHSAGKQT